MFDLTAQSPSDLRNLSFPKRFKRRTRPMYLGKSCYSPMTLLQGKEGQNEWFPFYDPKRDPRKRTTNSEQGATQTSVALELEPFTTGSLSIRSGSNLDRSTVNGCEINETAVETICFLVFALGARMRNSGFFRMVVPKRISQPSTWL